MTEEKVIPLTEFKTVIEKFEENQKRMHEVMQFNFEKVNQRLDKVEINIDSLREQIALLHEGQTEIKNELKQKVDSDEFGRLELRVVRLENKTA